MGAGPACRFPEHHHRGGGGFPWGLAVIVAGGVTLGTSATFARDMNAVKVIVITVCVLIAASGLGTLALVLHHQRAVTRRLAESRRPIVTYARVAPGMPAATREAISARQQTLDPAHVRAITQVPVARRRGDGRVS